MSRRRKIHIAELPAVIEGYANMRGLDFKRYSEFHMRLMDGGLTAFDIWTTGRYFVLATDYRAMGAPNYAPGIPRKGQLPALSEHGAAVRMLDKVFFPEVTKK